MTPADLSFACRFELAGSALQVHYSVTSRADHDVYVLDQLPLVDRATHKGLLDLNALYVAFRAPAGVHLLKGIPPLPVDRSVFVRVIPLGTRLSPGATLERSLELPLPLQEQGSYWGLAKPEDCDPVTAAGVVLTVQVLRSTATGFEAHPATDFPAPDLFLLASGDTIREAVSLDGTGDVAGLQLLRRRDRFVRV